MMMATGGGVPPEQLLSALENHPNLGAMVLFFGFPQLTDAELATLEKYHVKMVVVSSFRPGYKRLMERRAIDLAIVPRPAADSATVPAAATLRERFDQEFAIITPAEAARLP
jgi:hypothetical protein